MKKKIGKELYKKAFYKSFLFQGQGSITEKTLFENPVCGTTPGIFKFSI